MHMEAQAIRMRHCSLDWLESPLPAAASTQAGVLSGQLAAAVQAAVEAALQAASARSMDQTPPPMTRQAVEDSWEVIYAGMQQ